MILLDILFCILLLFIGSNFKNWFSIFDAQDKILLNKLFIFHIIICVVFHVYVSFYGGDAEYYWFEPKSLNFSYVWQQVLTSGRPTEMMWLLHYFPSNTLGLSFFTGNIFYGVLGYTAFVFYFAILKVLMPKYKYLKTIKILNISIFPLVLFLPNLHFWSSGVGKDTILFFCIALFFYSVLKLKKRILGVLISLLVSYLLRPHITLFLLSAYGVGYLFSNDIKAYKRFFFMIIFAGAFTVLFSSVLSFVKIDEFNSENIEQFSNSKVKSLSAKGGSTVDISNYPYPLKVLTFLYRPFFFDINNPLAILASFENLLLLILTIKFLMRKPISVIKNSHLIIKSGVVFFLLGTMSFSLILGNLGIMLRQKNMFMPMFILFMLWSFYQRDIVPYLKPAHED